MSQKVIASEEEATLFSVFQQLAEATSHIPILDDWVMLERSEKRRLTAERESIEKNYSEFMQASAKALMTLSLTSLAPLLYYTLGFSSCASKARQIPDVLSMGN